MVYRSIWKFWLLVSAAITAFALTFASGSTAYAQGVAPVEGRDFRRVPCRKGDVGICVRISTHDGNNINTPSFASQFDTTMADVREHNQTATIPLCRTPRGKYRMPRIRSVQERANQEFWSQCPEDRRYAYLVPGEFIRIPPKSEASEVALASCSCADLQAKCGTVPAAVGGGPVPPSAGTVAAQTPEPAPAAPPPPVVVRRSGVTNGQILSLFLLIFLAVSGAIYGHFERSKRKHMEARLRDSIDTETTGRQETETLLENLLRECEQKLELPDRTGKTQGQRSTQIIERLTKLSNSAQRSGALESLLEKAMNSLREGYAALMGREVTSDQNPSEAFREALKSLDVLNDVIRQIVAVLFGAAALEEESGPEARLRRVANTLELLHANAAAFSGGQPPPTLMERMQLILSGQETTVGTYRKQTQEDLLKISGLQQQIERLNTELDQARQEIIRLGTELRAKHPDGTGPSKAQQSSPPRPSGKA